MFDHLEYAQARDFFWQTYRLEEEGVEGYVRFNHLDGAVEVFRPPALQDSSGSMAPPPPPSHPIEVAGEGRADARGRGEGRGRASR